MTKPDVLQVGPYPEWDQAQLDQTFHTHKYFEAQDKAAFLEKIGPQVQGIAARGELGASSQMIAACPNLKIISVYGVGYDAVDLPACRARGIRVTNTPDVLTGDVADLAVGMMLALSRGIIGAEAWARSGAWAAKGSYPLQRRVWGRRAGVLGLGRIGHAVARRLAGFDMQISYSARAPKPESAAWAFVANPVALAAQSEILFVILASMRDNRHIVGRAVLEALGPEGLVINVSRAANTVLPILTKRPCCRRLRPELWAVPRWTCSRASPR